MRPTSASGSTTSKDKLSFLEFVDAYVLLYLPRKIRT